MKVVPFSVPKTLNEAFRFQEDLQPHFYDKLHQHPELQIMLILKGEGTLVAGDYVGRFEPTDLFIIGSEQAHVFRNDEVYYQPKSKLKAQAISIYFNKEYVGDRFWNLDEMKSARDFTERAKRSFKVNGKTKETLTQLIDQLKSQIGFEKLLIFFQVLSRLSNSLELQPLSVTASKGDDFKSEGKRMNDILQFTFHESHRKIYLHEIAEVANLSIEAFCRYFKTRTRKTYTSFLNEVRVSNACRLLLDQEKSVQEVCYQAGFNNISNFNRVFKKVVGKAPSNYLK